MWEQNELFKLRQREGRCIQASFFWAKNVWVSTHTNDIDKARKWCRDRIIAVSRGDSLGDDAKLTFGDFADGFFSRDSRGYIKRQRDFGKEALPAEYKKRNSDLTNYLIPKFGSHIIDEIKPVEIENWYSSLKSVRYNRQLASGTKLSVLETMNIVMKEALRCNLIKNNPVDGVERLDANTKERKTLSNEILRQMFPDNIGDIISVWSNVQYALAFSIAIDTGFRISEILGLADDCYIPEKKGIFTDRIVDANTNTIAHRIKTTKKGAKFKIGYLSDRSIMLIECLPKYCRETYWFYSIGRNASAFIRYASMLKRIKTVVERFGLDPNDFATHNFRHTFQTRNELNLTESELTKLMGHSHYHKEYSHQTAENMLRSSSGLRDKVVYGEDKKEADSDAPSASKGLA